MAEDANTQSTPSVDTPMSLDPIPTITEGTPAQAEAKNQQDEAQAPEKGAEEIKAETQKEEVKTEAQEKVETKPEEKKEEEVDRFDKHPRFQELNKRTKDAETKVTKLEAQLELLNKQLAGQNEAPKTEELDDEELTKLFDENPGQAMRKVLAIAKQQAKEEVLGEINEKHSYSQKEQMVKEFVEQNPDFQALWDDGTLQKFVDEKPIHNPISAYLIHTMEGRISNAVTSAVEEATAKVKAEYEAKIKEIEANHKAKKEIKVIHDAPVSTPPSTDSTEEGLRNSTSGTVGKLTDLIRNMRSGASA